METFTKILTENDTERAFDSEIIIRLTGTTYDKTSGGEYGYITAAATGSIGYKPLTISRKEVGYTIQYKAESNYKIKIKSAGSSSAIFSITRLDNEQK